MINDIRLFFYNYLHVIFGRAISRAVFDFFSLLLIVRILTPDNYGVYVLFGSISAIISILVSWTHAAMVRFGREEYIKEKSIKKTFWANVTIIFAAFAICLILIFILRDFLTEYINIPTGYYYLIFLYILVSNLMAHITTAFQAIGKMKQFAYLPLIYSIVFLAVLAGYYFSSVIPQIELLIGINIICNLITIVVGLWLLRKDILPFCFSKDGIKKIFLYSWTIIIGGAAEQIAGNIDQIVINMYLPISFVGIYSVAYRIFTYLITIPMLSISLTFPLMTSMIVEKKESAIAQYIKNYAPVIAFLWAVLISIPITYSREIFLIFGSDYSIAYLAFTILLLELTFRIFAIIESPIFTSYAIIKELVFVAVMASMINLGLDFLLIPKMGISGGALATAIAFISANFAQSYILKMKLGMNNLVNYWFVFPAILCFGSSMVIDNLLYRTIVFVAVMLLSFILVKRLKVFNPQVLDIVNSIDMPIWLRQSMKRVYVWMM